MRPHELTCVSSGYSKPCCQVVQPETAAGPLLAYPKHPIPGGYYLPRGKMLYSSIGK